MRGLLVAAALTIGLPGTAHAGVAEQVAADAELGRAFWQARGVTGCEDGFSVELFYEPGAAMMQGGFCRLRVNLYWQPPNPWAASRESRCALVFHEVKHALPGGETGGIDGQGHTADGLMATEVRAVPTECLKKRRRVNRARIGPLKGVFR